MLVSHRMQKEIHLAIIPLGNFMGKYKKYFYLGRITAQRFFFDRTIKRGSPGWAQACCSHRATRPFSTTLGAKPGAVNTNIHSIRREKGE